MQPLQLVFANGHGKEQLIFTSILFCPDVPSICFIFVILCYLLHWVRLFTRILFCSWLDVIHLLQRKSIPLQEQGMF